MFQPWLHFVRADFATIQACEAPRSLGFTPRPRRAGPTISLRRGGSPVSDWRDTFWVGMRTQEVSQLICPMRKISCVRKVVGFWKIPTTALDWFDHPHGSRGQKGGHSRTNPNHQLAVGFSLFWRSREPSNKTIGVLCVYDRNFPELNTR